MTILIINGKGKLVATYGAALFVQSMGGGLIADAVARYNKLNHEYKAVRI